MGCKSNNWTWLMAPRLFSRSSQQAWQQAFPVLLALMASQLAALAFDPLGKGRSMDLGRFVRIPRHRARALQLRRRPCVFAQTSSFTALTPTSCTFVAESTAATRTLPQGNQHVSCPILCPFPWETSEESAALEPSMDFLVELLLEGVAYQLA